MALEPIPAVVTEKLFNQIPTRIANIRVPTKLVQLQSRRAQLAFFFLLASSTSCRRVCPTHNLFRSDSMSKSCNRRPVATLLGRFHLAPISERREAWIASMQKKSIERKTHILKSHEEMSRQNKHIHTIQTRTYLHARVDVK